MTFAKELDQLIAKHLGSKATFGDYMAVTEGLDEAKTKLDWEAETRVTAAEAEAWEEANTQAKRA